MILKSEFIFFGCLTFAARPRSDAYADYTLYYTLTKVSMKTGGTKMNAQGF